MRYLEVFGQHTFRYAAEFLDGSVTITSRDDTDTSYSFSAISTGIITDITSNTDVNWLRLFSTQGDDPNDEYRCPFIQLSKTATNVDNQREGAIFFGGSSVGSNIASIVGYHHDVSDSEGAIQLSVRSEAYSGTSSIIADFYGNNPPPTPGNVIKGYGNGAGIVNVDLGYGSASTTTIAGNTYITSNIELGHASDTTISRSSAGVVQIEGSTIATAANLATLITDLHGAGVDGAANQLLTDDGDGTVTSESTLTWDGSMLTVSAVDDPNEPVIKIRQTDTTSLPLTGGELRFDTDRNSGGEGLGNNNDMLGFITWRGHDSQAGGAAEESIFAKAVATAVNVTNNAETGKLELQVLNPGGSLTTGLSLQGLGAAGHINATVGQGTLSTVTIEGNLNVGGHSVNDIDITSEASDADDHLMTALAIKNRIEDYGYATASSLGISGSANQLLTDDGDGTVTSESYLTFANSSNLSRMQFFSNEDTGDEFQITTTTHGATTLRTIDDDAAAAHFEIAADGNITLDAAGDIALEAGGGDITGDADNYTFTSATSDKPVLSLTNTNTTSTQSASLKFIKDAADVAVGEVLGEILFIGDNDAGTPEQITYAKIWSRVVDETDGSEEGSLYLGVASHDGELQPGISIQSGNAEDEVDVIIGNGANSITHIDGSATIGSLASHTDVVSISAIATPGNQGGVFEIQGSNGNGTNKTGGNLRLNSGESTGTGEGGRIILQGSPPGSSGSSTNTALSRWSFYVGKTSPYLTGPALGVGARNWVDLDSNTFENSFQAGEGHNCTMFRYAPAGTQSSLSAGQIYFLQTDGSWAQADASATSTGATQLLGVIGMGGAIPSKGIVLEGFVRIPSTEILNTPGSGAVDGLPVYISTTAGHFDFTAPSGNNEYVRCMGYAIDDHSGDVLVYLKPDNTYVKITA